MISMVAKRKPTDRSYFFDKGLRFACQQCGACCCGEPGTIYVSAEEIEKIARHLKTTPSELKKEILYPFEDSYSIKEHNDGRCYFYNADKGGCTIYEIRPKQCSSFPFWMSHLRNESRWRALSKQCPGIGEGKSLLKEEVLQRITKF